MLAEESDGRQRFRVADARSDHDRLVGFLRNRPGPCRVAMAPTGNYHRPLAYRLLAEGFEVYLVSSVAAARFREALFNSWDKNDPEDAAVILDMLKQGEVLQSTIPLLRGFMVRYGPPRPPDLPMLGRVHLQRLIRPPTMVVAEVLGKDPFEVPLVHNDAVVEALASNRPDHFSTKGFCEGLRAAISISSNPTRAPVSGTSRRRSCRDRAAGTWAGPAREALRRAVARPIGQSGSTSR